MQTSRTARTRTGILDAALGEFLDHGYGSATLGAVALRAAVSTATLHKYYPTKRALFGGVMARFWENDEAQADTATLAGPAREVLGAVGTAYAGLLLPATTVALFRVIVAETIRHPEVGQELYERGKQPYLERLEVYVGAEVAAERLHVTDVPLAVRQFLGMINDVVFWPRLLVSNLAVSSDDAATVVDGAVETFLARYGRRG